jgi:hypothetical protein
MDDIQFQLHGVDILPSNEIEDAPSPPEMTESNEISEIKRARSRGSKSGSKSRSIGKSNDGSNSDITSPTLKFNRHRETSDKLDEYLDIKIDE